MYEPLIRRDRNLNLEPALATEWANVNPTTWRFKLRHGVTFHDGTLMTAEDVLFSFQRAVAPGSDLAAQMSAVKEVKKIDDDTVDFITEGPPRVRVHRRRIAIIRPAKRLSVTTGGANHH
jgi:peptide/nickel transport system substrate-binding protein